MNECDKTPGIPGELEQLRADSAKVVRALDAAIQLIEALLAWMPGGLLLPESVKTAKSALDEAMRDLRR